ncbi:MAG: hypothetical protein H0V82_11500 [Candidatus Protochlamydia sp.]|nr:hypothetical protein [Candidatus Protochlamydia sp.]
MKILTKTCMILMLLCINVLAQADQDQQIEQILSNGIHLDSETYENSNEFELLNELFKPKYKKQKKGKSHASQQMAGKGVPTSPCVPEIQQVDSDYNNIVWHFGQYKDGFLLTALEGSSFGTQVLFNNEGVEIFVNDQIDLDNAHDFDKPTLRHQYSDCEVITTKEYQVILPKQNK